MIRTLLKSIMDWYTCKRNKIYKDPHSSVNLKILKKTGIGTKFLNSLECSGKVNIGRYSAINGPGTRIVSKINDVIIGNFCSIASNVVIQEYYHNFNHLTSYFINRNIFNKSIEHDIFSKGSIIIQDDVWIGSNSVILSGVTIGRGAIIGAGSIVTKDVAPYSIVAGNPAKEIRKRFSDDTIKIIEKSNWWEWDTKKLKENKELFNMTEKDIKIKLNEIENTNV